MIIKHLSVNNVSKNKKQCFDEQVSMTLNQYTVLVKQYIYLYSSKLGVWQSNYLMHDDDSIAYLIEAVGQADWTWQENNYNHETQEDYRKKYFYWRCKDIIRKLISENKAESLKNTYIDKKGSSTLNKICMQEDIQEIESILKDMKGNRGSVFYRVFFKDEKQIDVSKSLNISVQSVYSKIRDVRKKLMSNDKIHNFYN